jgi:hypothetical protein
MRTFYIGRSANTIYPTVSYKYDQIEQKQTLAAGSIKSKVVLPPSPQFIAIEVQEDPGLFFNEVRKIRDTASEI